MENCGSCLPDKRMWNILSDCFLLHQPNLTATDHSHYEKLALGLLTGILQLK